MENTDWATWSNSEKIHRWISQWLVERISTHERCSRVETLMFGYAVTSVAVLAETLLRSPWKLFIFIIKKYIYRINASKKKLTWFWKKLHWQWRLKHRVCNDAWSRLCVQRTSCQRCAMHHSCWRASFLAFCLGGRPAICTIYIPDISFTYPMYIYNYLHLWRAARNVKNPPANNYAMHHTHRCGGIWLVRRSRQLRELGR